jgi:hypothetical protein
MNEKCRRAEVMIELALSRSNLVRHAWLLREVGECNGCAEHGNSAAGSSMSDVIATSPVDGIGKARHKPADEGLPELDE